MFGPGPRLWPGDLPGGLDAHAALPPRPAAPRTFASSTRGARPWCPRKCPRLLPPAPAPAPGGQPHHAVSRPCRSIPRETSAPLRQLLLALLQRNHKDRMDFGERGPSWPRAPHPGLPDAHGPCPGSTGPRKARFCCGKAPGGWGAGRDRVRGPRGSLRWRGVPSFLRGPLGPGLSDASLTHPPSCRRVLPSSFP